MEYEKTNWVNGETPINETNLNHIEGGIEDAAQEINDFTGKFFVELEYAGNTQEQLQNAYEHAYVIKYHDDAGRYYYFVRTAEPTYSPPAYSVTFVLNECLGNSSVKKLDCHRLRIELNAGVYALYETYYQIDYHLYCHSISLYFSAADTGTTHGVKCDFKVYSTKSTKYNYFADLPFYDGQMIACSQSSGYIAGFISVISTSTFRFFDFSGNASAAMGTERFVDTVYTVF